MNITIDHDIIPVSPFAEQQALSMRVLRTPHERQSIAELRRLSPACVEDDLGLGLSHFETVRDQIGMVLAYERQRHVVATLRFVPNGHGMTGLERLPCKAALPPDILGPDSWECGRVVVDPNDRRSDVLGRCFSLALMEITRTRRVERFYAIATPLVARLWRRYGMQVAATIHGASGNEYQVVQGRAIDVAAALKLPMGLLTTVHTPAGPVNQTAPRPALALT